MRNLGRILFLVTAFSANFLADAADLGPCESSLGADAAQLYAQLTKPFTNFEVDFVLDRPSVGKISLRIDGERAAGLEFVLLNEGDKLVVLMDDILVEEKFRRLNLSKVMLAYLLIKYPHVHSIDGEMMKLNLAVIDQKLAEGLSLRDAVKETPAYKIRRSLGFTEIDESSLKEGKKHNGRYVYISVRRPD